VKKLFIAVAVLLLASTPALADSYAKLTFGAISPKAGGLDATTKLYGAYGRSLEGMVGVPLNAEVGIGYYSPSNGPVELTVIPVTLTALYETTPIGRSSFSVGAGLGLYFWDLDFFSQTVDDGTELGFHFQAGAQVRLTEKTSIIAEWKWISASDIIDLGGTSVNVGFKRSF
jgi:opacity protein-like surface antigen